MTAFHSSSAWVSQEPHFYPSPTETPSLCSSFLTLKERWGVRQTLHPYLCPPMSDCSRIYHIKDLSML